MSTMMDQMNVTVQRLGLPSPGVTNPSQLTEWDVFAPDRLSSTPDGYIRTEHYHFAGFKKGICLIRLNSGGFADWPDQFSREGVAATNANKEIAYKLAAGWLQAVGVDVQALEKTHKPTIEQGFNHAKSRKLVSPNFYVHWGKEGTHSKAEVQMDAARKWLVALYINDLSFYRKPLPLITNSWAVSMLPDEPVRKLLSKPGIEYTNAFALLHIEPTYEVERRRQLTAEIARVAKALEVNGEFDLSSAGTISTFVNPPAFGLGGAFSFKECVVRFDSGGNLSFLHYLPKPYTNIMEHWEAPLIISSNRAFEIASEKLATLRVDVERLNKEQEHQFRRGTWLIKNKGPGWFETCEFEFRWGKEPAVHAAPAVQLVVSGAIGKVCHFEINDTSYYRKSAQVR